MANETLQTMPAGRQAEIAKNLGEDLSWVIIRPRVTEKAADLGGDNIYTFDVATRANKIQIKKAIKALYNVEPVKVRTINNIGRRVFVRGQQGRRAATKKAMVFLKKGDSITFA